MHNFNNLFPNSTEGLPSVSQDEFLEGGHDGQFLNIDGSVVFMTKEGRAPIHEVIPEKVLDTAIEYPGDVAITGGFDLEESLKKQNLDGQLIEVAGPTVEYNIINTIGTLPEDMLISNIEEEPYGKNDEEIDKIDYIADATKLPHPNESIGAIFTSAFGGGTDKADQETAQDNLWAEFNRVLRPGGYVVVQHMFSDRVQSAIGEGFTPMAAQLRVAQSFPNDPSKESLITLDAVFRKPLV